MAATAEALQRWNSGCVPRGGDLPTPSYGGAGISSRKIFENIGASWCFLGAKI